MESQWYLCSIYRCPSNEDSRLKKTDNLSVNYPEKFLGDVGAILGYTSAEDNKKGEGESRYDNSRVFTLLSRRH